MTTPRDGTLQMCPAGVFFVRVGEPGGATVRKKLRLSGSLLLAISGCAVLLESPSVRSQSVDVVYQAAVNDYHAGHNAQAAHRLESILSNSAANYEVHELLGLVYASMAENQKAVEQLRLAVELKPDSSEARVNLGVILEHTGNVEQAGEQFRKALQLEPASYDANHNLGELYANAGQLAQARPLLAKAYEAKPEAYGNGYDLAMTDFLLGHPDDARRLVVELQNKHNTGEVHNLLAQINEKEGKFVEAASEYEAAAHLDPSESNLFDWGSEMLLHRTYEPAIAIFQKGVERFPKSARLHIGLGLGLYARDKYDEAVKALLAAAALTPSDARCYYFLSKAYNSSRTQADDVTETFRRYAALKPKDARAQYYYALSLWKGNRVEHTGTNISAVEVLLRKAIALDDSLADAHVQLGNLYADQRKYEASIPQYERALALDPNLSDAHYRLGTDYVHVGKKEEAQKEFDIYQKLRAQHLAEVEKRRADVQQFVYSEKPPGPGEP